MLNWRVWRIIAVTIAIGLSADPASSADTRSRYIRRVDGTNAVVVFVHGVMGDSVSTWTNDKTKSYWPDLISRDPAFSKYDIYVYEFPSRALQESFSISEVAESIRLQFDSDEVATHREIIFVAHSMGGLAVRAYLLKNHEVAKRVRFLYFYATPTTGSSVAALAAALSRNPQFGKMRSTEVSEYLGDLETDWLDAKFGISSYCAYETQRTFGAFIVTKASAARLCTEPLNPIDANHIDIAKPSDIRDASYLALKRALAETNQRFSDQTSRPLVLESIDTPSTGSSKNTFAIEKFEKDLNYALLVDVEAKFSSDAFNSWNYLSGIRDIVVTTVPEGTKATANHEISTNDGVSPRSKARGVAAAAPRGEAVRYRLYLKMKDKPKPENTFEFRTGPRRWTVQFGQLKWIENRSSNDSEKSIWWSGKAALKLQLNDPDWVVLHHARVLPIKQSSNEENKDSFLEVTVENRTRASLPINSLMLSASQIPTFACYDPGPKPPPLPEQLSIDWPRIVKKGPIGATGSDVLVTMYDSVVTAQASFQTESCLTDTRFSASVPIKFDLSPGEMGRISLRMKERTLKPRKGFGRQIPTSLLEWDYVSVSINPSNLVYPSDVSLYAE